MEESNNNEKSKLNNITNYILNDKNKFFNWIYPTYEDTSYKYIENEKLNYFNETQGQLFAKQFLVDSPYRGILLYHGLGTGKTCAALITSENLILKKHVLLFIPASLKQNWIDELSFCGNPIYKTKEHIYKNYTFINYNSSGIKEVYLNIKNNIYLDTPVTFNKNGNTYNGIVTKIVDGKFTHKLYKPNNIIVTLDEANEEIQCNINEDNVKLVSNTNPFDNKIIIFDEVHNFIVTLSNIMRTIKKPSYIQKIRLDIYNDLKNAINCKIILLSGTPIVNNAYEIAFISNILNGNNVIYKYDYLINSNSINKYLDTIKTTLTENLKFINYINIELDNNKLYLYFMLNPDYFVNTNNYEIVYDSENNNISTKLDTIKNTVESILSNNNIKFSYIRTKKSYLDSKYLPDNIEKFNETYLETAYDKKFNIQYYKSIKNINTLKSLLAGKISYLRGDLPIKTIVNTLEIPMGEAQENEYTIIRGQEIEQSRRRSKNSVDDENLANLRSRSRQVCNIYLPDKDKKYVYEEVNVDTESDDESNTNKENIAETLVLEFINKFRENLPDNLTQQRIKILENINNYSCKFSYLIDKLLKSTNKAYNDTVTQNHFPTGKVLIYSDFREILSGGVSFVGRLLQINELGFINLEDLLLNNISDLFETASEKEQQKNSYFEQELKDKIIKHYITILDTNSHYKNKVFYMWKASDSKSTRLNYMAHFIYNCIENLNGELLRIMFITKSGSEGISFKSIRQVHIIEPFWQQTRETQVIGRAVRRGSHNELEESKRNVFVYKYLCKFRTSDYGLYNLKNDNNLTTDQYITSASVKKQSIINSFYNLIKSVALDCPYNNEQISCFSYNNIDYYENVNTDPIYFNDGISTYNLDLISKEAQLVINNNQKFIVYNNNLYDYEKYILHSVLIKIGIIEVVDNKIVFNITRDYSANKTCFIKTEIQTNIKEDIFNSTEIQVNNIDEPNNYTLVKLTQMVGGASDYESDESEDYDTTTESSSDESISDLSIDENLINIREEEKLYSSIELYIDDNYEKYNLEDYICLIDNISKEKILIGLIKKITNKYILVNNQKIPIISKDTNNIILYEIHNRKTFINNLGLKVLNLYTQSDNIYLIYDVYYKNTVIDELINNILLRLQKYPRNYSFEVNSESSDLPEETLDDKIVEQLLALTDKSINKDNLENLSTDEDYEDLNNSVMSNRKINTEKASVIINDYYIKVIVEYYNTYINYLNNDKLIFENANIGLLIKKLSKFTNEEFESNMVSIKAFLKLMLYVECSMVNSDILQIDEFVHFENNIIQDLYEKVKLSPAIKKLLKSFTFYKNSITTIENDIDLNTEEYLSENTEEESSEDIVEVCYNINKNADIYFSSNFSPLENHPQMELIKGLMCFNKVVRNNLYSIKDFELIIINDSIIGRIIDENITRFIDNFKSRPVKKKKVKKSKDDVSSKDTSSKADTVSKEEKVKKKKTKKLTSEEASSIEAPNEEAPSIEAPNEEAPNEEAPSEEVPKKPSEESLSSKKEKVKKKKIKKPTSDEAPSEK